MSGIIDSRKWVENRLRHLQAALGTDITDEQRTAIEAEIKRLRGQAGSSRRRMHRWLFWGGRLPEQ